MMFTSGSANYWNASSGDYQNSPWNQTNWAQSPSSGQQPGPAEISYGNDNLNHGSFLGEMYGEFTSGNQQAGQGYWEGGTPGAGRWIEAPTGGKVANPDTSNPNNWATTLIDKRSPMQYADPEPYEAPANTWTEPQTPTPTTNAWLQPQAYTQPLLNTLRF